MTRLWYRRPADKWTDALPVGNGRLGGMVFGGIAGERIQLNEDTLWSGAFRQLDNAQAAQSLEGARRLIEDGKYAEAQDIVEREMLGEWNESYMPMADLLLTFGHDDAADYVRSLDLERAVASVSYRAGGVAYVREVFASAADQVVVIRLTADKPGRIAFDAALRSELPFSCGTDAGQGRIRLAGQCPDHVEPNYVQDGEEPVVYGQGLGMRFGTAVDMIAEGGHIEAAADGLRVCAADAVTLLIAAATDGRARRNGERPEDPEGVCDSVLARARTLGHAQLLARHLADYQPLFRRVRLQLGEAGPDAPTDERVARAESGEEDAALTALLFQYGRYLLIAGSRPRTEALNLQGIWNDALRPPWSSNYTININTQMNYWPAEVCNLSECHEPLFDLIADISRTGRETARLHYGSRGWTAHHNVDFWRTTVPAKGRACWSFWPMGGAWLCLHLWEHYAFSGDRAFLRDRAYPLMKEAALFCLDWLVEDSDGHLVTSPSTSPENTFRGPDGRESAVSAGSTMDLSIIRQLFLHVMESSRQLDTDADLRSELESAVQRMLPFRIGRYGQLQEWSLDFDEIEPGHRHYSHLYGLFPGNLVDTQTQAELTAAYRTALERRLHHGSGKRGWCAAWVIHFWARLGEPERALQYVEYVKMGLYPNLFNGGFVYQIDGNFGFTSGIAEMLLQSHSPELVILPALPQSWPNGHVSGLRARGGYEVDIRWEQGRAASIRIYSAYASTCRFRVKAAVRGIVAEGGQQERPFENPEASVYVMETEANTAYVIELA